MRDYTGYSNGEWIPDSQFSIDPDDMLSVVVFETLRTFNGGPFTWQEHVDRLFRSMEYVRIDPGLTKDDVLDILGEAVVRNEHVRHEVGDFNLWPSVTMGPTMDGPARVYVRVKPVPPARYSSTCRTIGGRSSSRTMALKASRSSSRMVCSASS